MEEKIKIAEYYRYKHTLKYLLLFTGVWPISKPGILYRTLPILTTTATGILSIMLFRFAIVNITNIHLMVKGFSVGTSYITIGFKVFLFVFYRESTIELYTILHNYHEESLADESLRYFVLKNLNSFRRLTYIMTTLVSLAGLMFFSIPIISIITQIRQNVQSIKYSLPFAALYPWEIAPGGLLYKITYIFETYNILCMATVPPGIDSLFAYYIFHIVGQLQILTHEITSIQPSDNHREFIRRWVEKFLVLKKCCKLLQKIYGPVILLQVITNAAVICTILFQVSHSTGMTVGRYLLIAGYGGAKIIQTFIYAWSGTFLTAESEALTNFVYFSDWMEARHQSFKTSILFIMTQKPLQIISTKCVIVSTDIFLMTINTAVSYFFLLKTVENKQS